MLLYVLLALISLYLPFQSLAAIPIEQHRPYDIPEAYEVYSAILPLSWIWKEARANRLVIVRETNAFQMCLRPDKEYEAIIGPAISDYVRLNQKAWQLQPNFRIDKPFEIITSDELASTVYRGAGGYEAYLERHPDSGGYIKLSAVGFNTDKTVAVVFMEHHCGGMCGGGQFYVLVKKDGKWVPLNWKGKGCGWVA